MKWNFVLAGVAALIMAGLIAFAVLHFGDMSVLNAQGMIALQERNVIYITTLLAGIVVLPVFFLLFFFAWRYRSNGPLAHQKHTPNWDHDSWLAEAVWWMIPAIIIVFISFLDWNSSHQLDPYVPIKSSNPPLEVRVVAMNWKWLFIYPQEGIATVNLLEVPVNVPVHFDITSDGPINSFWIPSLGGQIMAMAGMQTQLNLMANSLGTYKGVSANISGKGFAGMNFTVKSVSRDDFDAWIAEAKKSGTPLNSETYATLEKPSEYNPVSYYSSVEDGVYEASIMKYMMPMTSTNASAATTSTDMQDMSGMDMNMQGMQM